MKVLFPGVTIQTEVGSGDLFRQRHDLVGKKIILSVGRLVPRKGMFEFLKYSFPSVLKKCPEAVLVIIGAAAKDALKKNRDLTTDIHQIIAEQHLSDRVLLLGSVSDFELSEAYQAANVMVFPLRKTAGDVEGFGMVALEAAAHGLSTVAFSVDGVPDAIGENRSGYLVEAGNYKKMSQILTQILLAEGEIISANSCQEFAQQFIWSNFGTKLRQIVSEIPC
ncbi:MAG: glycosyltransferase [Candidatus Electrothrix sp. AUS3]|nr:glycosyltransferase [Candidatus Electrothrix gigas]